MRRVIENSEFKLEYILKQILKLILYYGNKYIL